MNINLYVPPKEGMEKYKTYLTSQGFNEEEAKKLELLYNKSRYS